MQQTVRMRVRALAVLVFVSALGTMTTVAAQGDAQQNGGDDSGVGSTQGSDQNGGDDQGGQGGDGGQDGAAEGEDIVTVLQTQGDFGEMADAVEQAGLAETLQGQGPFTVFAPTDEAWQQLSEDERETLMSDEGLSRLRTILSYHIVPDEIRAEDIQQMGSITTIQGQPLEVSRDGDQITVNDATVTEPGLRAGNGVVHGIDEVLQPQR